MKTFSCSRGNLNKFPVEHEKFLGKNISLTNFLRKIIFRVEKIKIIGRFGKYFQKLDHKVKKIFGS